MNSRKPVRAHKVSTLEKVPGISILLLGMGVKKKKKEREER